MSIMNAAMSLGDVSTAVRRVTDLLELYRDGLSIARLDRKLQFAQPVYRALADRRVLKLAVTAIVHTCQRMCDETGEINFASDPPSLIRYCLQELPEFNQEFRSVRSKYLELDEQEFTGWLSCLLSLILISDGLSQTGTLLQAVERGSKTVSAQLERARGN